MAKVTKDRTKPLLLRGWIIFTTAWVVLSAPLVLTFLKSEYLRYVFQETVAGYWHKFDEPRVVFVGDSITASGRNWGLRLFGNPLVSRTFAQDGYTTHQIQSMAGKAAALEPEWIFIMAGTNDIFRDDYELEPVVARFARVLKSAQSRGAKVAVTPTLYQKDPAMNEKIEVLAARITQLAREMGVEVVDLNSVVAPEKVLLDAFTDDGVHLSQRGLDAWTGAIRDLIESE